MNEQQWLACSDPGPMVGVLRARLVPWSAQWWIHQRKLRLFACACCRRFWHLLKSKSNRTSVETVERWMEGLIGRRKVNQAANTASVKPLRAAMGACFQAHARGDAAELARAELAYRAAQAAVLIARVDPGYLFGGIENACSIAIQIAPDPDKERTALCAWLRDLCGPLLFRPVTIDPAVLTWNSGAVHKLTQAIYDDRAFDRLPILADALEEAGCTDADLLTHCRGGGEHVRGCWLVDCILGKT
jgi:hypothetical protein